MKVPKIPDWVSSLSLNQAVQSVVEDGVQITSVMPSVHLIQFCKCTVLVPIQVKVQLQEYTMKKLFFLLKAQHGSDIQAMVMNQLKMFQREHQVYHSVLPKLEELYREVGKKVTFGPRAFRLDYSIGVQYVLLEDLKSKAYKNVERQAGFNKLCLKQVLKKLAQFHAASAVCVEKHGAFSNLLVNGVYTKANESVLQELNDPEIFLFQRHKTSPVDNMVQYYFYHLLDNLKALNFRGSLPQLQHIRDALNKNGLAAYVVVTRALPITMMNQFEDEVNERYASKMKCAMFTSRKYIQAMKDILPWMEERSLLN
ncbi:GD18210 [Drosophila simulans]|uniref:GD18210 n=1 Tax=Drosophila simulans TaxID=7240 RepID=B4QUU5_DROSI|nr:GD18210 [Drosophila simulans]